MDKNGIEFSRLDRCIESANERKKRKKKSINDCFIYSGVYVWFQTDWHIKPHIFDFKSAKKKKIQYNRDRCLGSTQKSTLLVSDSITIQSGEFGYTLTNVLDDRKSSNTLRSIRRK